MENKRILRLQELLQRELSQVLLREIEFSPQTLVTVSSVQVSPDLQHANIYISVIPEGKEREVMSILQRNVFHIQQIMNKKLLMRQVPKIAFEMAMWPSG